MAVKEEDRETEESNINSQAWSELEEKRAIIPPDVTIAGREVESVTLGVDQGVQSDTNSEEDR